MVLKQLDTWQQEVLDYDGNICLCTGRQNGKTFIMSQKIGKYMLNHKNAKIIVVSLTEDQAKLIIVMTLDYLESVARGMIKQGKEKPTQNRVVLKNGSQVLARPIGATGDSIRGFTGDVLVIDECSRMPQLAIEASKPTLFSTGGQIWVCSTPFGKKNKKGEPNFFYECFENKSNKFKVWHIDSEKVANERPISAGWTKEQREGALKHLADEKLSKSKTYYGQEYLALFLDELQRFFEDELIEKVCTLKRGEAPFGERFLGVDIGRMYDPSAFADIVKHKDKYYQIEQLITLRTDTYQTQQKILELAKATNYVKIGIDAGAGALGVGVYDNLMQTVIKSKLVAMNNRQIALDKDGKKKQSLMKEDYYNNLKAMMENDEIKLLNDEDIKASLRSVQWEIITSDTMNSRVEIYGGNTHIAESIHRAAYLAKKEKVNKLFITYM